MTGGRKLIIAAALVAAIGAAVVYSVTSRNRGLVEVEAGAVTRRSLVQSVTANGDIKPKSYVNISSNAFGRIIELPVAEGDFVEENQFLAQIESIQSAADVQSAQSSLDAAASEVEGMEASVRASEASLASARADRNRVAAELARSQADFNRAQDLFEAGLISREEFGRQEATFRVAEAQMLAAEARIAQADAQLAQVFKQREGLMLRMGQQEASVTRARDALAKTTITSPLSGVITYLPVNQGEIAVVGVQNQPGTTLMTIADMSVITAEVLVAETDIVNLKLGQRAEVRVDALGSRILPGTVSEIGNSALTASGAASTTTTTAAGDQAREFKVVITLDAPPPELRPGLSCTATIETAREDDTLVIPIQALTVREIDIKDLPAFAEAPPDSDIQPGEAETVEQEGVFVIRGGVAHFQPVKTGIVGTTDIEILEGLSENDQIVTGSYRVLRTLEDEARIRIQPITPETP